VEPAPDFAPLQLRMTDQMQWRYELIRPLVLLEEGTPAQRAQETQTHPDTVRTFVRRFTKQGLLGLVTNDVEVVKKKRSLPGLRRGGYCCRIPDAWFQPCVGRDDREYY